MPRFPRSAAALLSLSLAALILAGCSPSFDWRTVVNDDSGFTVMLPAKPTLDERHITIAGHPLLMQMQAAKAGGAVFAVGTVMLPTTDAALQGAVLSYLQAGLARNVGRKPHTEDAQVRVAGSAEQIDATRMDLSGPVPDAHTRRTVHARFVVRGLRVYQAVIVADHELPQEQIDQFFGSLRLY